MPEEIDLDIDPMLFYAAIIEDRVEMLDSLAMAGDIGGPLAAGVGEQMADICRTEIAQAQEQLDRLIEEDTTWS